MRKILFWRTLWLWLAFTPVAIINGSVRNFVYRPYTGELLGHQISTVTGILAVYGLAYFFYRKIIGQASRKEALWAGVLLVLLTILFEFGFGHYIAGNSWEKLLADYNLLAGRVWSLFLLNLLFTPYLLRAWLVKKTK